MLENRKNLLRCLLFTVLFVVKVVLGRSNSDVLRVIKSLIASSYLDRNFAESLWQMESVTTLQNDFLEKQYM